MDAGLQAAGFRLVWANDVDEDARRVYRLNLGAIDGRDIAAVPAVDVPDCDVIAAGFPCQPFSAAGRRRGVNDRRGNLYLDCLRIVEAKKPAVVLLENVKGILAARAEDGRKIIDIIKEKLETLGFLVSVRLLNAADYGVPQNRERVFIVAFRRAIGRAFEFPPAATKAKATLRRALDIPSGTPNQAAFLPYPPQTQSMIEKIPSGGSWKSIPYSDLPPRFQRIRDDMRRYHSPNFYCRRRLDEPSGTITASAQPEKCAITHPTQNRRFTIREAARIQSFPDSFLFLDGTRRDIAAMYRLIGNAVPPRLAETLGRAIQAQAFGG